MCKAKSGQTTCDAPGCNHPIYIETDGTRHPFCGRMCARKYGDYAHGTICKRVGCNKPTFVEPNGRVRPYCGRTCAHIDITSNSLSVSGFTSSTEQLNPSPACVNDTNLPPTSNVFSNSTIVPHDVYEDFVIIGADNSRDHQ